MSVEQKIKELLARTGDKQSLTEESKENLAAGGSADIGTKAAAGMSRDTSKSGKPANAGDASNPKQGDSKEATFTKWDEDEQNPGAKAAAGVSKNSLPANKGDAKSMKVQSMESTETEDEAITEQEEVDISSQLNAIFGEELSEEFKTKATSIFEAAVIARVNSEMEKVTSRLEEENIQQLQEFKTSLVEKVDGYLNYVVEQWMEENQLAVDSGLRTEIAEDFITGLKGLFQEHYIEVPEEKFDVLEELQTTASELEDKLNEEIEKNIAASQELAALKASLILGEQSKDLAATEAEKLRKLVEGVEFENEDLYREKISVIKENYFPKAQKTSPEKVLVEESAVNQPAQLDGVMSKYVQALSRTVKAR